MAERSVKVRLTAVIDDFRRGMGEAAKSTEQVGKSAEQAEQKSSRLADAGKAIGRTAAAGLAVASTAVVGLGVAALRTGVAYNSLEQTSRAALTTLLGSAEAANEQMDKLREFGRTSPFARQVWIEAQNQLLAFGFAAEDVIPTLQSINDAMSALGGSNQDISEVVRILAQVQSTGRVTAETLNQLGVRGINAAELLGQAFGKSANEIREEIRSGSIDAQSFLTTLVSQMSTTYAGAADLVRQTWVGAVDRIKGAFRDIGSILAAPFIDPQGGGAAVDWANALADAMRALEAVMGPVVAELAQRAGPAFDRITDTLERAAGALRETDIDNFTGQLDRFAPAVAGLGAAGLVAAGGALPFFGQFAKMLIPGGPLTAGIAAFVLAVPEARNVLGDLLEALAPLIPALAELTTELLPLVTMLVSALAEALGPVVSAIGAVVDSTVYWIEKLEQYGLVAKKAGDDTKWWEQNIFEVSEMLVALITGTDEAESSAAKFGRSAQDGAKSTGEFEDAVEELNPEIRETAEAAEAAAQELETYLDTVKRATDPVYALESAIRGVESAERDSTRAKEDLKQAERDLAKLRKDSKTSAEDLADAERKVEDAQLKVDESAWNMSKALDEAERAALNGELAFDEFEARLDLWVRQGKITRDEADRIRDRVKLLRGEAEDYADNYNATISQTGADATMRKIRDVKALVESFKNKGITLTVNAQTGSFKIVGRGFAGSLAEGGPVFGGGTGTSDSVPAWLSRGEHVWTAKEVSNAGGHEAVEAIRDHFRFAKGGGLGRLTVNTKGRDPNAFATDFSSSFARTLGRDAARAGKTLASVTPGRVLPRGSYRIGMPYLGYPGHYGADYPAPPMTPVYAMAAGVVERAMRMATSYGNHIFLRHAQGIQTRYAHLLGLRVSPGQMVGPGQHIGWVGSSGNSTGPHLHFEHRRNGAPTNPARLGIFDGGGVLKPGMFGGNASTKPEAVLTDRQWATMHAAAAGGGALGTARVDIRISGDGAQAEAFKASHRKGEIKILVNGQAAQVV